MSSKSSEDKAFLMNSQITSSKTLYSYNGVITLSMACLVPLMYMS